MIGVAWRVLIVLTSLSKKNAVLPVMHAYPMYAKGLSSGPLDPDYVPFCCLLTSCLLRFVSLGPHTGSVYKREFVCWRVFALSDGTVVPVGSTANS